MMEANRSLSHRPVMIDEVVCGLAIREDGCYVDATYGRGGHAQAIAMRLGPAGRLLIMDRDPAAIDAANERFGADARVKIIKASFASAAHHLVSWISPRHCVDGALLDVGVSSPQLDDPSRGFSFLRDGPLDMRMDTDSGQTAADWLAQVERDELCRVIRRYGEERFAKRIANAICRYREQQPLHTTAELAAVVADAVPRAIPGKHPATRTFQAIRIAVNRELDELAALLPAMVDALCRGGRLAVISFHSLEDRLVKRFFKEQAKGDNFPIDLAVTADQLAPIVAPVGRAQKPSAAEIAINPRARSARLRVVEKLAA